MAKKKHPIKIVECPRDAMQGIHDFIPTAKKVDYLNALLAVGFDTLDFGSFVSPKAVPQMRDTLEVVEDLDLTMSNTSLLAIVANLRGAKDACEFAEIEYLGFPFSISETFQQRNTNKSQVEALKEVEQINILCEKNDKQLVVYFSMAFGNPYGDPWELNELDAWAGRMADLNVGKISLADTIGTAQPEHVRDIFELLVHKRPYQEFGAHFHAAPDKWQPKIQAAYQGGCRRFDGALQGFGGCPFAQDALVGNIATENILSFLEAQDAAPQLNMDAFDRAHALARELFAQYS